MSEDWPSPHHHEPHPLPRVEDIPAAWEGYDRERVHAAFDAFYRHIAQLDATLRALESVEVFRQQAADLRGELHSIRAAGWAPYPRGYVLTPERSMLGSVPEAVPRIALEVIFLVIVAAVVAVAKFSALEIVGVMAAAVLVTFLVELVAARERRAETPIPAEPAEPAAPAPVPAPVRAPEPEPEAEPVRPPPAAVGVQTEESEPTPAEDGAGWAAFAEPEPVTSMGVPAVEEDEPGPPVPAEEPAAEAEKVEPEPAVEQPEPEPVAAAVEPEPEPEPVAAAVEPEPEPEVEQPEPEPAAAAVEPEPEPESELEPEPVPLADVTEAETGTIKRARFRRRKPEQLPHEPPPAPKHVRVLPPPEAPVAADAELPPWERGFDETDERRR
jgi:hypothetical protein